MKADRISEAEYRAGSCTEKDFQRSEEGESLTFCLSIDGHVRERKLSKARERRW